MSDIEECDVCGGEVNIMARRGSGICCNLCEDEANFGSPSEPDESGEYRGPGCDATCGC